MFPFSFPKGVSDLIEELHGDLLSPGRAGAILMGLSCAARGFGSSHAPRGNSRFPYPVPGKEGWVNKNSVLLRDAQWTSTRKWLLGKEKRREAGG